MPHPHSLVTIQGIPARRSSTSVTAVGRARLVLAQVVSSVVLDGDLGKVHPVAGFDAHVPHRDHVVQADMTARLVALSLVVPNVPVRFHPASFRHFVVFVRLRRVVRYLVDGVRASGADNSAVVHFVAVVSRSLFAKRVSDPAFRFSG